MYSSNKGSIRALRARELTAALPPSSSASLCLKATQLPISIRARFRRQKQVLGHLTSCYCMAFDRLAQILFTVRTTPMHQFIRCIT